LERKPTVPLKDLMMSVAMGARDDDTITSLANRLIRLGKVMSDKENTAFTEICGESCVNVARNLLNAFDEDIISKAAQEKFVVAAPEEVTDEQYSEISKEMAERAVTPFNNPKLRDYIEKVRKNHDQIIDNVNIDEVTFAGWDSEHAKKASAAIETFARFIEENKDTIEALEIIYSQSYRNRPLTLQMIQELYEVLQKPPYRLTVEKLWMAYGVRDPEKVKSKNVVNQLVDIISLVRYQLGQTNELRLFADDVNLRFRDWMLAKNAGNVHFTEEQTEWLRMIRDHIATSTSITSDDLDYTPFDSKGGLGKFYKLFGNNYENILREMNTALIAA